MTAFKRALQTLDLELSLFPTCCWFLSPIPCSMIPHAQRPSQRVKESFEEQAAAKPGFQSWWGHTRVKSSCVPLPFHPSPPHLSSPSSSPSSSFPFFPLLSFTPFPSHDLPNGDWVKLPNSFEITWVLANFKHPKLRLMRQVFVSVFATSSNITYLLHSRVG